MCYRPIRIVNKSDRIAADGGKPILYVPCGQCDQCLDSKKKEYYVRTFAEYQDILPLVASGDGMVYFDTLTYSPAFLPLWNGIKVFNHSHIQLFLKRLRKSLSSDGYPVDNRLRYFICSEYGENTQRPHYHVLFFLAFKIDVLKFWKYVRDCWKYGLNDRKIGKWLYKNGHHFYAPGAKDRVVDGNGALKYVSGYVVKDKSFMKIFNDKVSELVASGYEVDDKILRSLKPRFFMSRGFGLTFLEDQTEKYVVNGIEKQRFCFNQDYYEQTGRVTISDFKYLKQDFKIPSYYRRKLYFTLEKEELLGRSIDSEGNEVKIFRFRWKPNQLYKDYLINNFKENIDATSLRLHNIYVNLPDKYDPLLGQSIRSYVSSRLGQRSFRDLALYSCFYCNRIGYSGLRPVDIRDFVSRLYDGDCFTIDHTSKYTEWDSVDYLTPYLITDRSCKEFEHFDEILTILEGHNNKSIKERFQFIRYLREQKQNSKVKFKSYY